MGTITMTGFSVDADGDTVTKSLNNTSGGITNTGAIAGANKYRWQWRFNYGNYYYDWFLSKCEEGILLQNH